MTRYRIALFLLLATSSLLVWALPSAARQSTVRATIVTVTAGKPSEFRFTVLPKKVKHGIVTFKVTNKALLPHDFKIAGHKTKLLSPGQSQALKITFKKAGKFPYLCTVSGHAAAGMKGTLIVT